MKSPLNTDICLAEQAILQEVNNVSLMQLDESQDKVLQFPDTVWPNGGTQWLLQLCFSSVKGLYRWADLNYGSYL